MAILAGVNCQQILAALITMMVLYAADVIFIIVAYEVPKLQSLPMNVIAIVIMVVVPILGAAICLWWCKRSAGGRHSTSLTGSISLTGNISLTGHNSLTGDLPRIVHLPHRQNLLVRR